MKHLTATVLVASLLGGVPLLTGCDKEVEHSEVKKTASDGSEVKAEKTVKETPGGTVVTKEESKTEAPAK